MSLIRFHKKSRGELPELDMTNNERPQMIRLGTVGWRSRGSVRGMGGGSWGKIKRGRRCSEMVREDGMTRGQPGTRQWSKGAESFPYS